MKIKTFDIATFKLSKAWLPLLMLILLGGLFQGKQQSAPAEAGTAPVLLGVYSPNYLGTQSAIDTQLRQLDTWSGKRLSIAGTFIDLEDSNPAYNIPVPLDLLRQNGYTAFINFASTRTAAQIARGDIDPAIKRMATAYASWVSKGGGRMAFIAPLPEMNGSWETYKEDPANFKLAYQRIQTIFTQAGVPRSAVRWVFAPNGWSATSTHNFENYYPGNTKVDAIAFSSYNWGYCSAAGQWKHWDSPQVVFGPYIQRMRTMASTKPIFIAQTGTTSYTASGSQQTAKDQWFRDSYNYLASAPGVRGIIYFNLNKECDWAFYNSSVKSAGYKNAIANPKFGYVSPTNLSQMTLSP
ncbi:MAG: hypothetical protein KME08_14770 [Aphanothece sp. CMT-3BRIN-NPC111]|jgi:hypothetical protein|nr:hypothetical protein [Aphanothece sp. CMT-3BRIN-NPC111]